MNTEESQITNVSGSPEPEEKKKKERRKEKKRKQKKRKHRTSDSELENRSRKSKSKNKKRKRSKERKSAKKPKVDNVEDVPGPSVPVELLVEQSKSRAPMTKEEWEKSQNVIRRVYDETGRSRLVKGDGEIIEEIVSKDRHREINRQANIGDGLYFQSKLQTDKK